MRNREIFTQKEALLSALEKDVKNRFTVVDLRFSDDLELDYGVTQDQLDKGGKIIVTIGTHGLNMLLDSSIISLIRSVYHECRHVK